MIALVAEPAEVAVIAAAVAKSPLATFDLEFLAQDRLVPTLCLVQVSWLEMPTLDVPVQAIVATPPEVRLIDPLAVDVRPLFDVLGAHPLVVVHAARQDLGIVASRFGITMPAIADTQIMAAFAGIGEQIGLAALGNDLLGLALGKEQQWTDWAKRPLSPAQLAYADSDVRHLPALYAKLATRLGPRLAWALAESAVVAGDAAEAARVTPEMAWRAFGGMRGLDAAGLAALQELAAWRMRTAIELDKPINWVLAERTVVELAKSRPTTPDGIHKLKGITTFAKQRADAILAAIASAKPDQVAPIGYLRPASSRAQRWSEILLAIAQLVSEQTGVATRLLATRSDAEEFARAVDEGGLDAARTLPALATWRREVLGELWTSWLEGRAVLAGDAAAPSGIALLPRGILAP
ncbi:MAG: HRDC domain-containing protein [Kofleriaceae bacterium]